MIVFNIPPVVGKEADYIRNAIEKNKKLSGDGPYTKLCSECIEKKFNSKKTLLTTSCTSALEMSAILCDIQAGDEVIAPSFTFVSTVNAFVLRGAKIVFVDIRPDTMNMDEKLVEAAITNKTKAIVVVHYAGVSCEMDIIMDIASRYSIKVVEDAAQGVMSTYRGKFLGTIGDYGTYSFHETKNYTCGEGGALLIRDEENIERAEIIREKGTNRSRFFRGQVDKYTWVDMGSSYLPSEINAAYLYAQLEAADVINSKRLNLWNRYWDGLNDLNGKTIDLPFIPDNCTHNGHMFYIKCKDLDDRTSLIEYLKENDIMAVFHYIPLHSAEAGLKFGRFSGEDRYTTIESERLLRLPLFYELELEQVDYIVQTIRNYYHV